MEHEKRIDSNSIDFRDLIDCFELLIHNAIEDSSDIRKLLDSLVAKGIKTTLTMYLGIMFETNNENDSVESQHNTEHSEFTDHDLSWMHQLGLCKRDDVKDTTSHP